MVVVKKTSTNMKSGCCVKKLQKTLLHSFSVLVSFTAKRRLLCTTSKDLFCGEHEMRRRCTNINSSFKSKEDVRIQHLQPLLGCFFFFPGFL